MLDGVERAFDRSCERWCTLYRAALAQAETQNRIVRDAEEILTTRAKQCENCGYFHPGPGSDDGPDLCENRGPARAGSSPT